VIKDIQFNQLID